MNMIAFIYNIEIITKGTLKIFSFTISLTRIEIPRSDVDSVSCVMP